MTNITGFTLVIFVLLTLIYILYQIQVEKPFIDYGGVNTEENTEENTIKVREITKCADRSANALFGIEQRGDLFALVNFIKAERCFSCHESITYTTHGDYTFLENVPSLVEHWNGPISVALYAPGDDFLPTLQSIAYLRNCETSLIKMLVTFHIIIISGHFPSNVNELVNSYEDVYDCKKKPPYDAVAIDLLYRRKHNLTYPINVARNIASQAATTHFILASDIELYPSPNFVQKFLRMISEKTEAGNASVYTLTNFEIGENENFPQNKTELRAMLKSKKAVRFHERICSECHKIPEYDRWLAANETDDLNVLIVTKRKGKWEPFYVGTQDLPLYDERLSWEGRKDKFTQNYALCLLDYDYLILDNAFLIHKPGIKKTLNNKPVQHFVDKTTRLVQKVIKPELIHIYGAKKNCYLQ